MKKNLLLTLLLVNIHGMSQTNTFPSTGNVGIGTTNPAAKLDIQGNLKASSASFSGNLSIIGTDASWAENLLLIKHAGWGGVRFSRRDPTSGNYDGNWAIGYNAFTNNDFSISSNYSGVQYDYLLHISSATRNVGIGTSSPSEKLSVNGNILAKKLKITQVGWADHVFNEDYELKSLTEIERYIKINKHLPEVPTTIQVERDGVDVGENQSLLLKKIEELTLYLIEQEKKQKMLEQQIGKLEEIIKSIKK